MISILISASSLQLGGAKLVSSCHFVDLTRRFSSEQMRRSRCVSIRLAPSCHPGVRHLPGSIQSIDCDVVMHRIGCVLTNLCLLHSASNCFVFIYGSFEDLAEKRIAHCCIPLFTLVEFFDICSSSRFFS